MGEMNNEFFKKRDTPSGATGGEIPLVPHAYQRPKNAQFNVCREFLSFLSYFDGTFQFLFHSGWISIDIWLLRKQSWSSSHDRV